MKLSLEQIVKRRAKVRVTASKNKGRPVRSVEQLAVLAHQRKSVYCDNCWGLLPAVCVLNMAASVVHRELRRGVVFQYKRPAK
jgi:hypothetical protein